MPLICIQYCYAHLLRDVKGLEKDFPEDGEVKTFVSVLAPLLALAIKLRKQPISDEEFSAQAKQVKSEIVAAVKLPALHLGIRHIQDIFREKEHRMYHWAVDRRVPADNNPAERDLRPTVVARKVSFGSQSDAGKNYPRKIAYNDTRPCGAPTIHDDAVTTGMRCFRRHGARSAFSLIFPDIFTARCFLPLNLSPLLSMIGICPHRRGLLS